MVEEDPDAEDPDRARFPSVPASPELPDAPKLAPTLPSRSSSPGAVEPGARGKLARAAEVTGALIWPVAILAVGGAWLDNRWHTAPWLAASGLMIGFAIGVTLLLRLIKHLAD